RNEGRESCGGESPGDLFLGCRPGGACSENQCPSERIGYFYRIKKENEADRPGARKALRRSPRNKYRVRLRNGELSPLPFHDVGPEPGCDWNCLARRVRIEAEMIISPFVNVVNREQRRGSLEPPWAGSPFSIATRCYLTRLTVLLRYAPPPWRRRK